jgi:hypothetical protein
MVFLKKSLFTIDDYANAVVAISSLGNFDLVTGKNTTFLIGLPAIACAAVFDRRQRMAGER